MALFGFGKKKKEEQTASCSCQCGCSAPTGVAPKSGAAIQVLGTGCASCCPPERCLSPPRSKPC